MAYFKIQSALSIVFRLQNNRLLQTRVSEERTKNHERVTEKDLTKDRF